MSDTPTGINAQNAGWFSNAAYTPIGQAVNPDVNPLPTGWSDFTLSWRALALLVLALLLLTPSVAAAFSLGEVGAFFGVEPGSRLAKPYAVLKESFYPSSVAWSANGRYIADTGILTPLIHIWDVRTKRIVQTLSTHIRKYSDV